MHSIDVSKIKTYPLGHRKNLVHLKDIRSLSSPPPPFNHPDLEIIAEDIVNARSNRSSVIWMMGAHVIKNGLSRYLIDLINRDLITHVGGNGAVSIHDFEIAMIGQTSEDVALSIEDGTFGMAEETGFYMNHAIRRGASIGEGYGRAIGHFMDDNPGLFPYRDLSVLYAAYKNNIPATIHVTVGADIIHQHPTADFASIGAATGEDFYTLVDSVANLNGGVFLNFGSAVTGPELFLKALTIARNLGNPVEKFTTANFDLIHLGDYHKPVGKDNPDYYYRPRKNIVNRPTSLGGRGYHIQGDHVQTIPNLYVKVLAINIEAKQIREGTPVTKQMIHPAFMSLQERQPVLSGVIGDLQSIFVLIKKALLTNHTVFLCGNGGSMADAQHIAGELLKSYKHQRKLSVESERRLMTQPDGNLLIRNLQPGLRAHVLGLSPALATAVQNDMPDRDLVYAQEVFALGRPGDILIAISTSGNARNVRYAAEVAHAIGMNVVALTGAKQSPLSDIAELTLKVPESQTDRVQEMHIMCYHSLCEALESDLF